ncbi:MAG: M48 family metallopeptidase [Chlorobium sp.]|jgi:STE24 endopeptidase|uniref:M48 family metallopeptidase n=1 Tax=Chlorobium sp. TaxID=1095 RepID=UPI001E0FD7B1|nr:M48 family metallopeptidase [Chlorobium sp.]MBN1278175.1 M48 family metallopeptidase [Chlorobiaceae bacterium]MCF8215650.1 M48 family metallopeptidase [Chlorobium sp.]MCF8270705.1 M48 family metallopeptidase [Chlorobium sp.]MCF8286859.1 M48 family metallopeptidase [Chlorobium sp.]MCF8290565.1 M48 family metallopeptidase [Chlorobium sp.]
MNGFGVVVLVTLLLTFLLKVAADLLNLRDSSGDLPVEFEGVYDPEDYRKSQEYLRVTTRFSLAAAAFGLLLLLAFWFVGGFEFLDRFLRGLGFGVILTGVLYIVALVILQYLAALPFTIYRTFVIEERFGFNKTTSAVFVGDMLKSLLLAALIGVPALVFLLAFFTFVGASAWLWAWVAFVLFSLVLQYVAPTLIMPMFNRFEPLGDGPLRTAILTYAAKTGFPLSGIFVIDGSKRSSKANAFFTGFGSRKRIALFDTLIASHTVDELVAVLAHEIGHFKKGHVVINMVLGMLNLGFIFYLLSVFMNNRLLFDAFFMTDLSVYGSLVFFMLLFTPAEFLLSVLLQMLSRRHEYEADAYAVATADRKDALAEALKKLSRSSLSNLTPHPFYVFLNYSHPPVLDRVRRIQRLSAVES